MEIFLKVSLLSMNFGTASLTFSRVRSTRRVSNPKKGARKKIKLTCNTDITDRLRELTLSLGWGLGLANSLGHHHNG